MVPSLCTRLSTYYQKVRNNSKLTILVELNILLVCFSRLYLTDWHSLPMLWVRVWTGKNDIYVSVWTKKSISFCSAPKLWVQILDEETNTAKRNRTRWICNFYREDTRTFSLWVKMTGFWLEIVDLKSSYVVEFEVREYYRFYLPKITLNKTNLNIGRTKRQFFDATEIGVYVIFPVCIDSRISRIGAVLVRSARALRRWAWEEREVEEVVAMETRSCKIVASTHTEAHEITG